MSLVVTAYVEVRMIEPQPSLAPPFLPSHQPDPSRDDRFLRHLQAQYTQHQIPPSLAIQVALTPRRFTFELCCERKEVPMMRGIATWVFEEMAVDTATAEDLLMILEESFSNIIRHSYREADQKWVRWCLAFDEYLSLTLEDRGEGGRTEAIAERLAAIPETGRPPLRRGGMGLFLIKRMMDHVTYQPGDINTLRMQKQWTPKEQRS